MAFFGSSVFLLAETESESPNSTVFPSTQAATNIWHFSFRSTPATISTFPWGSWGDPSSHSQKTKELGPSNPKMIVESTSQMYVLQLVNEDGGLPLVLDSMVTPRICISWHSVLTKSSAGSCNPSSNINTRGNESSESKLVLIRWSARREYASIASSLARSVTWVYRWPGVRVMGVLEWVRICVVNLI